MATFDISDVQNQVLKTPFGTLVDFLQLNGWFGTVAVNGDGTITVNGVLLTSDQMLLLGQSMGITTSSS